VISVVNFEDYPVIVRLILGGERQSVIAERFGVSQGRISQVWKTLVKVTGIGDLTI